MSKFTGHKICGRLFNAKFFKGLYIVVTLNIERTVQDRGRKTKRRAQLHQVDLAGSERSKQIGDDAKRQSESKEINKSLLNLALMINQLAEKESRGEKGASAHIAYRNSKLTHLLAESLMGNCRTAMLACVSPAASNYLMTASTIRFAVSVKNINTKPQKNEEMEGDLVSNLKANR